MKYQDIPQFPHASYEVDVPWDGVERTLAMYAETGLELDPVFQRGRVWTTKQQIDYLEYSLKGGRSARNIYFNCPNWKHTHVGVMQLIDGQQRLYAVRQFMHDLIPVFGGYLASQLGKHPGMDIMLRFHVHEMDKESDVIHWYIGMNSGGTAHTQTEMNRAYLCLESALDREAHEEANARLAKRGQP